MKAIDCPLAAIRNKGRFILLKPMAFLLGCDRNSLVERSSS